MNIPFAVSAFSLGQVAWIVLAAIWMWKRRDEIPLITSILLFYVFTFRLWALLNGWTSPVNLSNFGFESVEADNAVAVLGIALWGESVFLATYMLVQKRRLVVSGPIAPAPLLDWLRPWVFGLAVLCIPIALVARRAVSVQVESGRSMGFEISGYLILFPLALGGIAILLAVLWRVGGLPSPAHKAAATASFAVIAFLTFQPSLRFQFFGWLLATMIIFSSGRSFVHQTFRMTIGLILAVGVFAVAGALRNAQDPQYDLQQETWERFAFAEDANMLDGFVLLRQIYPDILAYSKGGEHLEILTRPIPRAWWPNKPVGGYMNKLGLITAETGFTLGISPSLFGSFYQEGGLPAMTLLAALYGLGLALLVRFSVRVLPLAGLLIRAIACAAIVPLLRGGDLPGIYAWFGMSFWPCVLLLLLRRREFFGGNLTAQSDSIANQTALAVSSPRG